MLSSEIGPAGWCAFRRPKPSRWMAQSPAATPWSMRGSRVAAAAAADPGRRRAGRRRRPGRQHRHRDGPQRPPGSGLDLRPHAAFRNGAGTGGLDPDARGGALRRKDGALDLRRRGCRLRGGGRTDCKLRSAPRLRHRRRPCRAAADAARQSHRHAARRTDPQPCGARSSGGKRLGRHRRPRGADASGLRSRRFPDARRRRERHAARRCCSRGMAGRRAGRCPGAGLCAARPDRAPRAVARVRRCGGVGRVRRPCRPPA